ncbi:MAG: hypothetical protein IJS67_03375 [Clostridia bacterium]|nr:hypothetical protein [Clostridia bacterium]
MNKKYLWDENDIKFIDKDDINKKVEYSVSSFDCPFKECSYNTFCNGKCSQSQEEKAYDAACDIYDDVISSENNKDASAILKAAGKRILDYASKQKATDAFVLCLKIQVLQEIQMQLNYVFSKEEKDGFLNAD